jgi:hypothetical protein
MPSQYAWLEVLIFSYTNIVVRCLAIVAQLVRGFGCAAFTSA